MRERTLTPTSYLVLGLVEQLGPCTSYDMKKLARSSIGMFWSFPHSQLYAEPARLLADGLLAEEREDGGRRRRLFRLTPDGARALADWRATPTEEIGEVRDEGLLKLFFSDTTDVEAIRTLAANQGKWHRERMNYLIELRAAYRGNATPAQLAVLELGLRWDRAAVDFWNELEVDPTSANRS